MDTIGYFVYGPSEKYWAELRLSVLSLLRESAHDQDQFRIVVVCDSPGRLDDLPVQVDALGPDVIRDWSGPEQFSHRAKLGALRHLSETSHGRAVLVDTDTYFVANPTHLFGRIRPGHALMHASEGPVGEDDSELAPRMGSEPIPLPGGRVFQPEPSATLWNSGVVGLDSTDRDALDDAEAILDELYRRTGAFNVEQFAIGQALEQRCELVGADDVVVHYWGVGRDFLHVRLSAFESEHMHSPLAERTIASRSVTADVPPAHPMDRIRARMRRAAGLPPEYVAACLAAWSADRSRRSAHSKKFASSWEQMAHYHCAQMRERSETDRHGGRWSALHSRYVRLWLTRDPALQRVRRTTSHKNTD